MARRSVGSRAGAFSTLVIKEWWREPSTSYRREVSVSYLVQSKDRSEMFACGLRL